jgi:hypothetical protein
VLLLGPDLDPEPEPEPTPQYDGTGTYTNGETTVWYDTEGDQHVSMNDSK